MLIAIDDGLFALDDLFEQEGMPKLPAGLGLSRMMNDWPSWLDRIKTAVASRATTAGSHTEAATPIPFGEVVWLAPLRTPRKLICMGTNYAGHAKEVASKALAMPYGFLKPPSNILCGSGSDVTLLAASQMNDWEIELAVVIGKAAKNVGEALDYVAGYAVLNDVSSRDWVASRPEFLGIDWVVGKAANGYAPMGPLFTPAEFVEDPQNLDVELTLNGETMQKGTTADMVLNVAQIIAHLSTFMTLEPGDIIATGTPEGVGFGRKPPIFLRTAIS